MGRPDTDATSSSVAAGRAVHDHAHGGGRGDAAPAPAPTGADSAFDTNVVIILAALFLAILFTIGLNSLGRYGGGGGATAAEGHGRVSARVARRGGAGGIRRLVLRSLPVEVYGGGGADIDDVCAICLGEFVDGEKVRVLPRCGHGFHVRCVDAWLVSHGSCPTCRRQVIEGAPAKGAGGGRSQRPAENDMIAVVIV